MVYLSNWTQLWKVTSKNLELGLSFPLSNVCFENLHTSKLEFLRTDRDDWYQGIGVDLISQSGYQRWLSLILLRLVFKLEDLAICHSNTFLKHWIYNIQIAASLLNSCETNTQNMKIMYLLNIHHWV